MGDFWNRSLIQPPPNACVCYKSLEVEKDFQNLKFTLDKCFNVLSDDVSLSSEIFILQKLIFKRANSLRRDKRFHALRQINTCMKRYSCVELPKIIKNFQECCTKGVTRLDVYLPSKHMFEFLLVRLMGTVKLLLHTVQYCERCFVECLQLLSFGHSIEENLLYISLSSRIRVIVLALAVHLSSYYKQIYSWLSFLKQPASKWLAPDNVLPDSLDSSIDKATKATIAAETKRKYALGVIDKKNTDIDSVLKHIDKSFVPDGTQQEDVPVKLDKSEPNTLLESSVQLQGVDLGVAVKRKTSVQVKTKRKHMETFSHHVDSEDKTDMETSLTTCRRLAAHFIKEVVKGKNVHCKVQRKILDKEGKIVKISDTVMVELKDQVCEAVKSSLHEVSKSSLATLAGKKLLKGNLRKIFSRYLQTVPHIPIKPP